MRVIRNYYLYDFLNKIAKLFLLTKILVERK